jgi:topoisomerase-4 subunit A
LRGGKIRCRARINQFDKSTLVIKEIPFATNTSSLIDSILKANDKGKIRIKKIEDNTAADVEILVHIPSGISPDKTIGALYAFTNCEVSISPLGCVIEDNTPLFVGVTEMLRRSTDRTVELLKSELEIQLHELEEQWHYSSLERIFIENRIYRDIEEEETWEGVIQAIDEGLKPFIRHLKRAVVEDDIVRLTEIRIKRISKFDVDKSQQRIDSLEDSIAEVKHHLNNLITYAVDHFKRLKKVYGAGKERKTEIRVFDDIEATKVVIRNTKLYVNREEGFVGTSLRRDEYVTDCSDIDEIIVFTEDGKVMITKVGAKTFVGKGIIHLAVFKKKDKRTIYNLIYKDGPRGATYVKRFSVTGTTRDKEYDLTIGSKGSKVLYFTANANGEAEVVTVLLRQSGSIKKLKFDLDFTDLLVKGRTAKGNIVTKYSVKRIELKEKGLSTLKPRSIWFDDTVQRLNVDARGELLGEFRKEDRLLIINQKGLVKTVVPELTLRFDDDVIVLEKWDTQKPISAIYWAGEKELFYVKRFLIENPDKEEMIVTEHPGSYLEKVFVDYRPMAEVIFAKTRGKEREDNLEINLEEFISVKGVSAMGNQLTKGKVLEINALDPLEYKVPEVVVVDEIEVIDEENVQTKVGGNASKITSDNSKNKSNDPEPPIDDEGQTLLF